MKLTNREFASLIWLTLSFAGLLFWSDSRKAIFAFAKEMARTKLWLIIVPIVAWFIGVTFVFRYLGYWNPSQLKDTVAWILLNTVVILRIGLSTDSFNKTKPEILKLLSISAIFLGFLTNTFTFNLITEILFQPVILIFGLMALVAESNPQLSKAQNPLNLILIVLFIIAIIPNFEGFSHGFADGKFLSVVNDATLPLAYAVMSIPTQFLLRIFSDWEQRKIQRKFENKV